MNKTDKKLEFIQGLRGYAIILIFISHIGFTGTGWWGALGVEVFIMISGFLYMYLHNNEDDYLLNTLKRKIKRFYPLHLITMIGALPFFMNTLLINPSFFVTVLTAHIFLIQSWIPFEGIYFSLNAVSWYLSLTVFFIIISPYLKKLLNNVNKLGYILFVLSAFIIEFLIYYFFRDYKYAHWIIYIFPICRTIDYAVGGRLEMFVDKINICQKYIKKIYIFDISLIIILMILSMKSSNEIFSTAIWLIPVSMLILSAYQLKEEKCVQRCFSNRFIVWIGNKSFEIFLFHWLIIRYVSCILNIINMYNNLILAGISIVLTFVIICIYDYLKNIFYRYRRGDCHAKA